MENMELNQSQAINVLIQAAKIGQSKGAYLLEDAELISKAIRVFIPKQEEGQDKALNQEQPLEVVK